MSSLGTFSAITDRKYTENAVSLHVCRNFAKDLTLAINNDAHNPGYSAYWFGYGPVKADGTADPTRKYNNVEGNYSVRIRGSS